MSNGKYRPTRKGSFPLPEDAPPVQGSDRVCAEKGCSTVLNRYHKGELCFVHQPLRFPVYHRAARIADIHRIRQRIFDDPS